MNQVQHSYPLTWEQTVQWIRQQPDQADFVRLCYLDDPLIEAAERFTHSEEWKSVRQFLSRSSGHALDVGAGRGVSSYALAQDGWQVVALEPDPSHIVGAEAIHTFANRPGLKISVIQAWGESIALKENTFDLVYARQVLHHSKILTQFCQEVARVLRPRGRFIAVREHVISKSEDLDEFLLSHPLQKFHGGENAFMLDEYVSAIEQSGLRIVKILGPFDSVINYYPMHYNEWRRRCIESLVQRIGRRPAILLASPKHFVGRALLRHLSARLSALTTTPGRIYSFVAEKPS